MKLLILKGTTSKKLHIFVQDATVTTGAGKTGLTNSSFTWYYWRDGASSATSVTTGSGTPGTWSSGGIKEMDATNMPGWYEIGVPDAVLASGANDVVMMLKGTNLVPINIEIQLSNIDQNDGVRAGLTALPNAAAEAAGGLYTRGTGAGQINQPANGQIDANAVKLGGTTQTGRDIGLSVLLAADQAVNTTKFGGTTVTARDIGASVLLSSGTGTGQLDFTSGVVKANLAQILGTALTETAGQIAAAFKKFFDKASPTGTINSLPDAVPGVAGGLLIDDVWTDARAAKLDNLDATVSSRGTGTALDAAGVRSAVGLASANLDTQFSGIPAAVWNALTSGMSTAGSVGKRIVDYLTGDIFARLGSPTGASVSADVAAVKTDTAAIKTKTDNLPTDPADASDIATATGAILADTAAIKAQTDQFGFSLGVGVNANMLGINHNSNTHAEIAQAVWEDDNSVRATTDSAGNKLRQALILYGGN